MYRGCSTISESEKFGIGYPIFQINSKFSDSDNNFENFWIFQISNIRFLFIFFFFFQFSDISDNIHIRNYRYYPNYQYPKYYIRIHFYKKKREKKGKIDILNNIWIRNTPGRIEKDMRCFRKPKRMNLKLWKELHCLKC